MTTIILLELILIHLQQQITFKKLFLGIDNKFPTFIKGQKLFFISNVNGAKFLNFFDLKSINKSFESETFSLLADNKQISVRAIYIFGVFIF